MKTKRNIFAELAEGLDALKSQRQGKGSLPLRVVNIFPSCQTNTLRHLSGKPPEHDEHVGLCAELPPICPPESPSLHYLAEHPRVDKYSRNISSYSSRDGIPIDFRLSFTLTRSSSGSNSNSQGFF